MNWTQTREALLREGVDTTRLPVEWCPQIDLHGLDLCDANLRGASLRIANLCDANLRDANLRDANLRGASLHYANLRRADLHRADLQGADLRHADLHDADLEDIKYNHNTVGIHEAPEGDLIGWGKKSNHIVKFLIPANARRSCATTRKYRAEYVVTLQIDGGALNRLRHECRHGAVIYEVGKITHADAWDEDRWNECSHGIHFFLTREEAEAW